jgi:DNA modification methylase
MKPRPGGLWAKKVAINRGLDPAYSKDGDLWRDPSPGMGCNSHLRRHPNEKPESLMVKLVKLCTVMGETICDPYMGSGTTGIACLRTGRNFIGIEKDPTHFATAVARLQREAIQGRLL